MERFDREITREEFNRYSKMNNGERNAEYAKTLPESIIYGYGFYGTNEPMEKDGKYYMPTWIGKSCD